MSGWSPPRRNLRSSGVGPLVLDGLSHVDWYSVDGMMLFEMEMEDLRPVKRRRQTRGCVEGKIVRKFGRMVVCGFPCAGRNVEGRGKAAMGRSRKICGAVAWRVEAWIPATTKLFLRPARGESLLDATTPAYPAVAGSYMYPHTVHSICLHQHVISDEPVSANTRPGRRDTGFLSSFQRPHRAVSHLASVDDSERALHRSAVALSWQRCRPPTLDIHSNMKVSGISEFFLASGPHLSRIRRLTPGPRLWCRKLGGKNWVTLRRRGPFG